MPLLNLIDMKQLKNFYNRLSPIEKDIIQGGLFGMMSATMIFSCMYIILYANQLYEAFKILQSGLLWIAGL
jgi:hypothetical protein